MKQFRPARSKRRFRAFIRFCGKNGQLLFLISLIVCGAVLGCSAFAVLPSGDPSFLASFLPPKTQVTDFVSGCTAVLSATFGNSLLIMLLFLFGLTAFGGPLILLAELFYGFCIGTAESQAFYHNGMMSVAFHVVIPMTIAGAAVLIAGYQAIHMSCVFTKQLLPGGAHCGGMWHPFRKYLLRFLLCMVIVLAAAVVQVVTQIFL